MTTDLRRKEGPRPTPLSRRAFQGFPGEKEAGWEKKLCAKVVPVLGTVGEEEKDFPRFESSINIAIARLPGSPAHGTWLQMLSCPKYPEIFKVVTDSNPGNPGRYQPNLWICM